MPSVARPTILQDPGYLFFAQPGSSLPVNTVAGGVFTDAWPVAWGSAGATEDGSEFSYSTKVEPTMVAEFFDPIKYSTTERSGTFAFNLADWTLARVEAAFNGGTRTVVSGTGLTQLNKYTLPSPGQEERLMVGWESLDNTVRIVVYQALQGGEVKMAFKKAPALAVIPCTFNFEIPAAGQPFEIWTAGDGRA